MASSPCSRPWYPPLLGAQPNSHTCDAESFRVLDGGFMFMIDGEPVPLRTRGYPGCA